MSPMRTILMELAKRIAEREGIELLRPGQRRPDGYYMGNRHTGRCRIPRGAVEDIPPVQHETVREEQ